MSSRLPAWATRHECITVKCTNCGKGMEDYYWGHALQFFTLEEAVEEMQRAEWMIIGDIAAVCFKCAEVKTPKGQFRRSI